MKAAEPSDAAPTIGGLSLQDFVRETAHELASVFDTDDGWSGDDPPGDNVVVIDPSGGDDCDTNAFLDSFERDFAETLRGLAQTATASDPVDPRIAAVPRAPGDAGLAGETEIVSAPYLDEFDQDFGDKLRSLAEQGTTAGSDDHVDDQATIASLPSGLSPDVPVEEGVSGRYGTIRGYGFDAHEVVPHAWLKAHGYATNRRDASNWAVAVGPTLHHFLNQHQVESGIRDPDWMAALDLKDILVLSAEALKSAGFDKSTTLDLCRDAMHFVLFLYAKRARP